jgi:hypothetical protein
MNSRPINSNGYGDRGYMIGQIAQDIAASREALAEIIALESDSVCERYCEDIIGFQPVTGVTINGVPLARGSVPSMVSPGMP